MIRAEYYKVYKSYTVTNCMSKTKELDNPIILSAKSYTVHNEHNQIMGIILLPTKQLTY